MARTHAVEATEENLTDKAAHIGQNIRDIGGQVRDAARETYDSANDAVHQQVDRITTNAKEYYNNGRERVVEWEGGIESYVREKPVQAVLIAAGVGVLLGILWKRH